MLQSGKISLFRGTILMLIMAFSTGRAAAQDTLLVQNFENITDIPATWTVIDNDADALQWGLVTDDPHSGVNHVSVMYNSSGNDDWLITPAVDLSGYTSPSFSFWAKSYSASYLEDFNVVLSTTGTDPSDFTETLGEERSIPTTYGKYTYDLSAYEGQSVYLAIQYVAVDKFYLYVDDISVTGTASTVPVVSADFSADVTSGAAPLTVNFTDLSTGATTWTWDFDNDGTMDATADANPSYTFSTPGTYTVSLEVSDGAGTVDTEIKTDYITVSSSGSSITSTTSGGNWSEITTWVGGVVPTDADHVVIDGDVNVDGQVWANHVTINAGKVLQNLDYNDVLQIKGDLNNYGTIKNNVNGYDFYVELYGDLYNAGVLELEQITFRSADEHNLSMAEGASFSNVNIVNSDTSSHFVAASDLFLSNATKLSFDNAGNPGHLILPENSGFELNLEGGSFTSYLKIAGNGNSVRMTDGAYFSAHTYLEQIHLYETIMIDGDEVYFNGNEVIVEDTLQNQDYSEDLNVMGNLVNNGVIRNNPNGYDFHILVYGDLINNGEINNWQIEFAGASDHTLTMSMGALFKGVELVNSDAGSKLIPGSDLIFNNVKLSYDRAGTAGTLELPFGMGYDFVLTGGSYTSYLNIVGNGNELILDDGAYFSANTTLSDIILKETAQIDGDEVYFTGSSVIVADTLQNLDYSDDLNVKGTLVNQGVIRNNPSGYDFNIMAEGDLINQGAMMNARVTFTGSENHSISMTESAEFRDIELYNQDSTSMMIAASDLTFTDSELNADVEGHYGLFVLPESSGFDLTLKGNSVLRYITLAGHGNALTLKEGAYLSTHTYLSDVKLYGVIKIDGDDVYVETDDVVLEDTLQNKSYSDDLQITGTLTNNGVIRDNPDGYDFNIMLLGNLINNGTITNYKFFVKGEEDQSISLLNEESISSIFELLPSRGTGSYQWYKDGSAISGETNEAYSMITLAPSDAGIYYASTNEGNSRTVTVSSGAPVIVANAFYVSKSGSDDTGTGASGSPFASIQKAIDEAASNDTVWVGDGSFNESINFYGKDIYLSSINGPGSTTIDGTDKGDIFIIMNGESRAATVKGFTITNGYNAFYVEGSNLTILDNIITGNEYGIYSTINWNNMVGSDLLIVRNLIHANEYDGVQLSEKGTNEVYNNTIVNNGGHGLLIFFTSATVRNNIIIGNGTSGLGLQEDENNMLDADYNLIYNNIQNYYQTTASANDINEDPLFAGEGDFNLQESSPAIDAGDPDSEFNDPDGTRSDIGAFYFEGGTSSGVVAGFNADVISGFMPLEVSFTDKSIGDIESWSWDFGDGTTSEDQNPVHTFLEAGTYSVKLTVSDGEMSDDLIKGNYINVIEPVASLALNEFKIYAEDGSSSDNFGYRQGVDIYEDYAIVGAYSDDDGANGTGSAYIFFWDGESWSQQIKLNASDAEENDWFGQSVDITDGYAIVGAPGYAFDATTPGAAYIYKREGNTWSQVANLAPDDGENGDQFGNYVAIQDSFAVVGAYENDGSGYERGAVYIFRLTDSGWVQHQKLISDAEDDGDTFGYNFVLHGDELLVGNTSGYENGVIYQYLLEGNTWEFKAHIKPDDLTENDNFGYYTAFDGNTLAVASSGFDGSRGKVFIFTRTGDGTWNYVQNITLSNTEFNGFGYNLDLSGNYLIAGAHQNDDKGYNAGAAYLFRFDGSEWLPYDTLYASDPGGFDEYGMSVAVHNNRFIVGSHGAGTEVNSSAGAAYIYMEVEEPEELSVNFSVDKTSGDVPLTIHFSDLSTGAVSSWNWEFGDGGSSDAQNPEHVYELPGIYTVSLTVSNGTESLTETKSEFITVLNNGVMPIDTSSVWSWLNPKPQGNPLWKVHSPDKITAYAVGSFGTVIRTNDGGEHWKQIKTLPTKEDMYAVQFLNESTGFVGGDDELLFKTTDAGETWTDIGPGGLFFFQDFFFFNEMKGIAIGPGGRIQMTTDGGENWTMITSGVEKYLNDITFLDQDKGFIVGGFYGDESIILKTSDGGNTWVIVSSPVNTELTHIEFLNAAVGFASGHDGTVIMTRDGGDFWTDISTGDYADLYSLHFNTEEIGYAFGSHIWKTMDGGTTWNEVMPEMESEKRSAFFNDSGQGYIVDVDGGVHELDMVNDHCSVKEAYSLSVLTSIEFYNKMLGVVAGFDGTLLRTTDGGQTFQSNSFARDAFSQNDVNDIQFLNKSTILAAMDELTVIRSDDAGQTWKWFDTDESGEYLFTDLEGIFPVTSDVIYVAGEDGYISKSNDGGESWIDISYETSYDINDLHFFGEDTGILVGGESGANIMLLTEDGGESFTGVTLPNTEEEINTIEFLDSETGYVAGANSLLIKTTDGGETWVEISGFDNRYNTFYDVDFFDESHGMIAAGEGISYVTSDGGLTWEKQEPVTGNYLMSVAMTAPELGFAAGYNGTILSYNPDEQTVSGILADFSADTTATNTVEGLQFTDQSTGTVTSWKWEFGDGTLSTEQHPMHVYSEEGVYSVTLTISDGTVTDVTTYTNYIAVNIGTGNESESDVPMSVQLDQNYPNPFNPSTNIRFGLPEAGHVTLTVYNVLGQQVMVLIDEELTSGFHEVILDASQLSSGMYFYELKTADKRLLHKMTMIK